MLTAGALGGVLPAGVLSVDDADRLTQASPTPARPISRTSSTGGPPFVGGRELDGTDISTQAKRPWCRVHGAHPRCTTTEMRRGGSAHELGQRGGERVQVRQSGGE